MKKSPVTVLCLALLLAFFAIPARANVIGDHPAYLHALSDLRAARWLIQHQPGDMKRDMDEMEAVKRIDKAIDEIKKASIDDGKNIDDHPQVDEKPNRDGRLHDAIDFLKKAREDISKDEDNGFAKGLRERAYDHIDGAIDAVKKAIHH
jgi:tetratricopeptide (TPR) repeat protein